jgi:hypothetical protein
MNRSEWALTRFVDRAPRVGKRGWGWGSVQWTVPLLVSARLRRAAWKSHGFGWPARGVSFGKKAGVRRAAGRQPRNAAWVNWRPPASVGRQQPGERFGGGEQPAALDRSPGARAAGYGPSPSAWARGFSVMRSDGSARTCSPDVKGRRGRPRRTADRYYMGGARCSGGSGLKPEPRANGQVVRDPNVTAGRHAVNASSALAGGLDVNPPI